MFIGAAAAHREAANSSFPVKLIWINFDKLTSNYLFENGQDYNRNHGLVDGMIRSKMIE